MDNRPLTMNAIGQITGFAERFSGNAGEGQDAWLYSPTTNTTHVIGLTDSAHTQTGGNSDQQSSYPELPPVWSLAVSPNVSAAT